MNKCTCPFEIPLFNCGNLSIGSSSENKEADKVQDDTRYRVCCKLDYKYATFFICKETSPIG